MIKYIRYKYDGGVDILEGPSSFEKFTITDITEAIYFRLNNLPDRKTTLSYKNYCEETCFLVKLVYDMDKLDQYLEKFNHHDDLILNFCNKNLISIYSVSFSPKEGLSKAIFAKSHGINHSSLIKAPLITLEEVKSKTIPLYFFNLKLGRYNFRNNLYYLFNDVAFCLPVSQLIDQMVENGIIEKFVKNINVEIDIDTQRVNIAISALRHAYGKKHLENNYSGYLDLVEFNYIIEKHEEELLSS